MKDSIGFVISIAVFSVLSFIVGMNVRDIFPESMHKKLDSKYQNYIEVKDLLKEDIKVYYLGYDNKIKGPELLSYYLCSDFTNDIRRMFLTKEEAEKQRCLNINDQIESLEKIKQNLKDKGVDCASK